MEKVCHCCHVLMCVFQSTLYLDVVFVRIPKYWYRISFQCDDVFNDILLHLKSLRVSECTEESLTNTFPLSSNVVFLCHCICVRCAKLKLNSVKLLRNWGKNMTLTSNILMVFWLFGQIKSSFQNEMN